MILERLQRCFIPAHVCLPMEYVWFVDFINFIIGCFVNCGLSEHMINIEIIFGNL